MNIDNITSENITLNYDGKMTQIQIYEKEIKKLQKQLEAYENMRKEAIEYIEHARFIREQVILKRSYALQDFQVKDLLNILNKLGNSDEN